MINTMIGCIEEKRGERENICNVSMLVHLILSPFHLLYSLIGTVTSSCYYVPILIVNMELILLIDPLHLCKALYKCMFTLGFCFDTWWEIYPIFILLLISFIHSLFTHETHLKDFLYVSYLNSMC